MANTTGRLFCVTTFGESHGPALGAVIDGCPPGLRLDLDAVQVDLDRRRPGQSKLTTTRREADRVQVLSGLYEGRTTGMPLTLVLFNEDARSGDYAAVADLYRPGHADFTYEARFGLRDPRGGGRASARETAARVAAAAVARQWLAEAHGVEVIGFVASVGTIEADVDPGVVDRAAVEAHPTRCPDPVAAAVMAGAIEAARADGDTLGGVVGAVARGLPAGWGAPVFDKLDAELAHACLSLPACKGFEIGSGFAGTQLRGSAHNDAFYATEGRVRTRTNRAGGVLGGISTGEAISIRCAFKPVSTHFKPQETVNRAGESVVLQNRGRHDPCVLPRAVPLVEAAMLLVLADHALRTAALSPVT
ncbi:MAG: chorismate synthase [Myxococcales bacterium]|nr:chorismate synthase [Myxococcales bacterium]